MRRRQGPKRLPPVRVFVNAPGVLRLGARRARLRAGHRRADAGVHAWCSCCTAGVAAALATRVYENEMFVTRFLAGANPVGHMLRMGEASDAPSIEIVGLVGDTVGSSLREGPRPTVYTPIAQRGALPWLAVTVRTAGIAPPALARNVAWAIGRFAPRGGASPSLSAAGREPPAPALGGRDRRGAPLVAGEGVSD